jgi:hypothetical protein
MATTTVIKMSGRYFANDRPIGAAPIEPLAELRRHPESELDEGDLDESSLDESHLDESDMGVGSI